MGPFRTNKPPEDARFPQTHLESSPKPPDPHLRPAAALRGEGPGWGEAAFQSCN